MFLLQFMWWLVKLIIKIDIAFVILTFFVGVYEAFNDENLSSSIGIVDIAKGLFSEIGASLLNLLSVPLGFFEVENWFSGGPGSPEIDSPVLVIHPYFGNPANMIYVVYSLKKDGFKNTFTIRMRPRTAGLEDFLVQIESRVKEIKEKTGSDRVALVGHSMGGLLARMYAIERPEDVSAVVTLGSPHNGSKLAVFGIGKCAYQMRWGSKIITEIKDKFPEVPFLSIYSPVDNLAVPQYTAKIPENEEHVNWEAPSVGHIALAFSPSVVEMISSFLKNKIH